MSETENNEESKCKTFCNPIGACLQKARGTIAKVWVWAGMIALSVSFALLYTYWNGTYFHLEIYNFVLSFSVCNKNNKLGGDFNDIMYVLSLSKKV